MRIGKRPGTTGTVRRPDRMLAAHLYERGVAVTVVENALLLGAARRLIRPPGAMPLAAVRSLAYFLPVVEEVLELLSAQTISTICAASLRGSNPRGRFLATPRPWCG